MTIPEAVSGYYVDSDPGAALRCGTRGQRRERTVERRMAAVH